MFEDWPINFLPPARIEVSPPMPVVIDLAVAIARSPVKISIAVPLRVRAEGLDLDQKVPGMLYAWARVSQGDWLCDLAFRVHTGNGQGYIDVRQWCPSGAAQPPDESPAD